MVRDILVPRPEGGFAVRDTRGPLPRTANPADPTSLTNNGSVQGEAVTVIVGEARDMPPQPRPFPTAEPRLAHCPVT